MLSKVKTELKEVNGVWRSVPVKYPDWYGIPGIGFIWVNTQHDPYIEYKGKQFNSLYVEDTMWNWFQDEFPNGDEKAFSQFMLDNQEFVYGLCDEVCSFL